MNVLYLKYAIEIEKTGSISKAAENLFMGQPNLSRAMKDLEHQIGIIIFKRNSKGIEITPDGVEFLQKAKKIIHDIDELEKTYQDNFNQTEKFAISVPRASYIADAFARFTNNIVFNKPVEIFYKETNSYRAMSNIIQAGYKLGIIRYQTSFDSYFKRSLEEKGLTGVVITEFKYQVLISKDSPLSTKDSICYEDLREYCEVAHGDPFVPSLPISETKKSEFSDEIDKRIYVFERASEFTLLERNPKLFMWVSPIPQELLDKFNLTTIPCSNNCKTYKDVLIYKKGYHLSKIDNEFIDLVCKVKREMNL